MPSMWDAACAITLPRRRFSTRSSWDTVGTYPVSILDALLDHGSNNLVPENTKKTNLLEVPPTCAASAIVDFLKGRIDETGPLLVEGIKPFDDYLDKKLLYYGGEFSEKTGNPSLKEARHAVLIVGAFLKDEVAVFMVQDSLEGRPFVAFEWRLLYSMGNTGFRYIETGVVFDGTTFEKNNNLTLASI